MSQFLVRLVTAIFSIALLASVAMAQDTATMQAFRDKVKADKKLVIAANMDLTEEEGKKFWPIYEAYQKDLTAINQRLATAITTYATAYNSKSLTDDQAKKLATDALLADEDEVKLRKTYGAKLVQVPPGKKAARYLQLENKIRAALRYELASSIPLVE
jgi:hypothetical protein